VAADLSGAADLSVTTGAGTTSALTWTSLPTPIGALVVVVSEVGIVASGFTEEPQLFVDREQDRLGRAATRNDRQLASVRREAREYLAQGLPQLRSPVDLGSATPFTRAVWTATMAVPPGELRTYGDIAAAAGHPRAWRAAGHALRRCPIELWIPCHRVVPAGPGLGDYGGRPDVRAFLLDLEGSLPVSSASRLRPRARASGDDRAGRSAAPAG